MINVVNPANSQTIAQLESDTAETVAQKAKDSRAALQEWKETSVQTRLNCLRGFGQLLEQQDEQCAADLTSETGKPFNQALGEVRATQGRLEFFLKHAEDVLQNKVVAPLSSGTGEEIRYEPLGVVANISAWNYPYFVGANVFVPALLTGNVVLYKPSELALLTGANITRAMHEAGLQSRLSNDYGRR